MTTTTNRFDKCPHCESECGMVVTKTIKHTEVFNFFGECMDVSGDEIYVNKFMTCYECHKRIMTVEQFKQLHEWS